MAEDIVYNLVKAKRSIEPVDWFGLCSFGDTHQRPLLALLGPPNEKNEVVVATELHICKAYLHDLTKEVMLKNKHNDISLDKMRLLASLSGPYTEGDSLGDIVNKVNLFKRQTKKSLNLYETLAKWKRTKVIPVSLSDDLMKQMTAKKYKYDKEHDIYIGKNAFGHGGSWIALVCFEGSGKWMSTPHFISMYTLLVRTGYLDIGDFNTIEQFVSLWKKFFASKGGYDMDSVDNSYMKRAVGMMHHFIEHREEIHKGISMENIWKRCSHSTGIADICQFNCHSELSDNFRAVYEAKCQKS